MKIVMTIVATLCLMAVHSHAASKISGKGDSMRIDPSSFPPDMKANYQIFKTKCVKCHTMERTLVAITTGVAPISGQPFDHNATKAYGMKMLRKPDAAMNKQEVKACIDLINYLLGKEAH